MYAAESGHALCHHKVQPTPTDRGIITHRVAECRARGTAVAVLLSSSSAAADAARGFWFRAVLGFLVVDLGCTSVRQVV